MLNIRSLGVGGGTGSRQFLVVMLLLLADVTQALFSIYDDLYSRPKYKIKYIDQSPVSKLESVRLLSESLQHDVNGSYEITRIPTEGEYSQFPQKDNDDGVPYLCHVPKVKFEEKNLEEQVRDQKKYKEVKEKAIGAVNKIMSNYKYHPAADATARGPANRCLHKTVDYWTYQLCYDQSINQFHQVREKDKTIRDPYAPVFSLARFSKRILRDAELVRDTENENAWNLLQHVSNGDVCDLTHQRRTVDIRYICAKENVDVIGANGAIHGGSVASHTSLQIPTIHWIKEYRTCQYEMVVSVPSLCDIEEFNNQQSEEVNVIVCTRIVDDDVYEAYVSEKGGREGYLNVAPRITKEDYNFVRLTSSYYFGLLKDAAENKKNASTAPAVLMTSLVDITGFALPRLNETEFYELLMVGVESNLFFRNYNLRLLEMKSFVYDIELYGFSGEFVCTAQIKLESPGSMKLFRHSGYQRVRKNLRYAEFVSKKKKTHSSLNDNDGPAPTDLLYSKSKLAVAESEPVETSRDELPKQEEPKSYFVHDANERGGQQGVFVHDEL